MTCFPPSYYESLINEHDYMFGDWSSYAFLACCLAGFIIGYGSIQRQHQCRNKPHDPGTARVRELTQVLAIILSVFSCALALGVVVQFVGDPSLFFGALVTGSADAIRGDETSDHIASGFSALTLLPVGFPLLIWSNFQTSSLHDLKLTKFKSGAVVKFCVVLYAICLVLTLQRNLLIPFILSVLIVTSGTKWQRLGVRLRPLFGKLIIGLGAMILLFLVIAYFRGGDAESPFIFLIGYLPASFNRLSATLQGVLIPPIPNESFYSLRFFWYPPIVRRVLPFDALAHHWNLYVPENLLDAWVQEFSAINTAGLNPTYIWSTAFGYTYYDFGWFSPLYFIFLGVVAGVAWNQFLQRSAFGIVLYPYIGSAVLLWATDNYLALPQLWIFIVAAGFLGFFERNVRRLNHGR